MITTYTEKKLATLAYDDDAVGTALWRDVINVTKNGNIDRAYPSGFYVGNAESLQATDVRLVLNDEIVGTNQRTNFQFGYDPNIVTTYGGASNMWGLSSIDPREIRDNDFGVALSMGTYSGATKTGQTHYIIVTGFNLRIPRTAVIKGVSVEVTATRDYAGPGIEYIYLYTIKMTVNYEWEPVLLGTNKSDGFLMFEDQKEPQISQEKSYQYLAYEDNEFRGQWRDVESTPSLKIAINSLPGELPVTLARNLDSSEIEYDEILLSGYGGDQILVTSGAKESILSGDDTSYGIGAGTDLEVDHTVRVKEYYGGYEALLTHTGEPLLTSQGEQLVVPNGYPRGRMYYHGYVSDYGLIYENDNQNTSVKLLHLSEEMNNEVYKTPDTLQYTNVAIDSASVQLFGGFFKFGDYDEAGQTFTAGATYKLKRIVARAYGWRDNVITATLRTGSTIGAGTELGSATGIITELTTMRLSMAFDEAIQLTNGQPYNITFTSLYNRQTQSQSYPAAIYFGNSNAGGQGYYLYSGVWYDAGGDLGLELWQEGGLTRVNELSIDPSQIMRKVLDYGKTQGNLMSYDASTIESTFTIVSAPFNSNTEKQAADYVLKLTPSNWYYFVDPGELLFHLHGQPTNVTQWFELKKDIIRLELHKNIENIVNEVLFTGGGDPALFVRYVDAPSRQQWRKGLRQLSDNRVTDQTTGDIVAENEADQNSQPIWLGTVEVLRSEHPKFVLPGQLSGFKNFGNIIDYLKVQVVDVEVTPDTFIVQLGTQVPKQSQRIEDIKRNLTRLEIENNPNAPS